MNIPTLPVELENAGLECVQLQYHGPVGHDVITFTGMGWQKALPDGGWQIIIPHPDGRWCTGVARSRERAIEYALRGYVDVPSKNEVLHE